MSLSVSLSLSLLLFLFLIIISFSYIYLSYIFFFDFFPICLCLSHHSWKGLFFPHVFSLPQHGPTDTFSIHWPRSKIHLSKKSSKRFFPYSQFHQHFTSSLISNILLTKKFQSQTVSSEKLCKTILYKKAGQKILVKLTLGVHFTNIIQAVFTLADPKSTQSHWWLDCHFAFVGSAHVKAARKTCWWNWQQLSTLLAVDDDANSALIRKFWLWSVCLQIFAFSKFHSEKLFWIQS